MADEGDSEEELRLPSAASMADDVAQKTGLRQAYRAARGSGLNARLAVVELAAALEEFPEVVIFRHPFLGPLHLDLSDLVCQEVYLHHWFEEELTLFFLKALRTGDTFYDVGAHMGYFSRIASICVGAKGRVVAFEPSRRTYKHLLTPNLDRRANARAQRWAVWEEGGKLTLKDYGRSWAAFNTLTHPKFSLAKREQVTPVEESVKAVALDDLPDRFARPDVIKVDVESAELQVVRGMRRLLKARRPVVTLEMGDKESATRGEVPKSADVLEAIAALGYDLFEPLGGRLIAHSIQSTPYVYMNMVCLPKSGALRDRLEPLCDKA